MVEWKGLFFLLSQNHSCRCPGNPRSQGISRHGIDLVILAYSGFSTINPLMQWCLTKIVPMLQTAFLNTFPWKKISVFIWNFTEVGPLKLDIKSALVKGMSWCWTLICVIRPQLVNPYCVGTKLIRFSIANIMAADALAPCVARPSAALILTI